MKKILLFALLLCTIVSYSQNNITADTASIPYSIKAKEKIKYLDKTTIPTGKLWNVVVGWSGLGEWENGDTVSVNQLYQGVSSPKNSTV